MAHSISIDTVSAGSAPSPYDADRRFRLLFINRVMLFAALAAMVMGYIRYDHGQPLMASIDIAFAMLTLLLLALLRSNKKALGTISLCLLGLCFSFFSVIYVMVPENSSRIFLFFLLVASTFFIKGRTAGFYSMWLSIFIILFFHFHHAFETGYSNIDIITSVIYLTALYVIMLLYDQLREHQSSSLKRLNSNLERKIKERTAELELANLKLLEEATQLEKLSTTDQLSGLYNRHKLKQLFMYEKTQSKRHHIPLSGILIDIDHFKAINDTYGHNTGDRVIKRIATLLRKNTRSSDSVGRWGGEEFLILLPKQTIVDAQKLAEKLRAVVEKTQIIDNHTVTLSCGVTAFHASESMESFIHRADMGLYCAKENGRNQVVALPSVPGYQRT